MPSHYSSADKHKILIGIVISILAIGLGFALFSYVKTSQNLQITHVQLASSTVEIEKLNIDLATALTNNQDLSEALENEKQRMNDFEKEISRMTHTVTKLDKLSKTDPELLKKYSRVYFLNENYIPDSLSLIATSSLSDPSRTVEFHGEALPFLNKLLKEAEEDEITLRIISAYRSFNTQASLKSGYKVLYGAGANQFSADQGYSEHQLGTTLDFTTTGLGGGLTGFEKTPAYEWLLKNAYKFGFVISYPQGNTYYQFEPWHWRFVGTDLADDLHDEEKNFYDLDQRDIDPYLIDLFD